MAIHVSVDHWIGIIISQKMVTKPFSCTNSIHVKALSMLDDCIHNFHSHSWSAFLEGASSSLVFSLRLLHIYACCSGVHWHGCPDEHFKRCVSKIPGIITRCVQFGCSEQEWWWRPLWTAVILGGRSIAALQSVRERVYVFVRWWMTVPCKHTYTEGGGVAQLLPRVFADGGPLMESGRHPTAETLHPSPSLSTPPTPIAVSERSVQLGWDQPLLSLSHSHLLSFSLRITRHQSLKLRWC